MSTASPSASTLRGESPSLAAEVPTSSLRPGHAIAASPAEHALASRICVAVICPNSMDLPHILSLLAARDAGFKIIIVPAGPYLDIERNKAIDMALEFMDAGTHDWVVCMDSDVQFDWRDLLNLCVDPVDHPITSGVYHNHFHDVGRVPVLYRWDPDLTQHVNLFCHEVGCCPEVPIRVDLPEAQKSLPQLEPDALGFVPIAGFGAGYLAIHSSVLVTMRDRYKVPVPYRPSLPSVQVEGNSLPEVEVAPAPDDNSHLPQFSTAQAYFIEQTLSNGMWYGEDFMFALRAVNDLGYKLYALPSAKGLHFKKVAL